MGAKFGGPTYTPSGEAELKRAYGDLIRESGKEFGGNTNSICPAFHLFSDASFASVPVRVRPVSGTVLYYRSAPALWRGAKQTPRTYSVAESEYAAFSGSLVMQQGVGFAGFFDECSRDFSDCPIFADNKPAICSGENEVVRPRSRHRALRGLRVRDEARRIAFCPTELEKADPLTKVNCPKSQRGLLFWHTYNRTKKPASMEVDEDSEAGEVRGDFQAHFAGAMVILP
jgi:hypothetical protein